MFSKSGRINRTKTKSKGKSQRDYSNPEGRQKGENIGYWQLFVSSEEFRKQRDVERKIAVDGEIEYLSIKHNKSNHRYPLVTEDRLIFRELSTVSIRRYVTKTQTEGYEKSQNTSESDWKNKSVSIHPQRQKMVIDIGKQLLNRVREHFSCVYPLVEFHKVADDQSGTWTKLR